MKTKISNINRKLNGDYQVTIDVPRGEVEKVVSLKDEKVDVVIKKWRNKRSLSANAYCWALLGKMSEVLKVPKEELYLMELRKWSTAFTYLIVKPKAVDDLYKVFRYIEQVDDGTLQGEDVVEIIGYYGSSSFDTKEMSVFIDGIVTDAKELGIETETPEEIERMVNDMDMVVCKRCGKIATQTHHIFGGVRRKKSDKYKLTIPLCFECHRSLHDGKLEEWNKKLKSETQKEFEKKYSYELWMKEFGKDYKDE